LVINFTLKPINSLFVRSKKTRTCKNLKSFLMKKPSNKGNGSAIAIIATLEEPDLLQILVEKLAECNVDMGYSLRQVQPGWKAIETSSIEVLASGGIDVSDKNDSKHASFVTSFLFTCVKPTNGKYNLTWSHSLS